MLARDPKGQPPRKVKAKAKPNPMVGASGSATAKVGVSKSVKVAKAKPAPAHAYGTKKSAYAGPVSPVQRKHQDKVTAKAKFDKALLNPEKSGFQSGALKILDQTTRPLHAVAGAADAAVTGKSIPKAALRGIQNKDKVLFSDVLKHAGAPGIVRSVGGFALDVGLDPTTYVTVGTGSVAKAIARKAEQGMIEKGLKAGLSAERSQALGKVAARQAVAKHAAKGSGVDIKFAGRSVPLVTRATAKTTKGIKRAASKSPSPVRKVGSVAREQIREVRPTLAPAGADKAQFAEARSVARKARASTNAGAAKADREARGLKDRLDKLEKSNPGASASIVDAIERGHVGSLPSVLQKDAREIRDRYRYLKRVRRSAGIAEGTIRDYFPHAREDALHARLGIVEDSAAFVPGSGAKRTGPTLGSSSKRTDKRTIAEQNPERVQQGKSPHSTDIPLVNVNYETQTARVVAENKAFRELADLGKPYKSGATLKDGEAVYHLGFKDGKMGLRPFEGGARQSGRYVVLDKSVVENVQKRMKPAQATTQAGRAFDRSTAGFKRVATFTPGFHVRNAIGDTQMAYLSQPGHKLLRNVGQAAKANRALVRAEKAQGHTLSGLVPDSGKTIKVAGKPMPVEDFVRLAEQNGVTNAGQLGREIKDLKSSAQAPSRMPGKVRGAGRKAIAPVGRAVRGRENVIRLSTFKHGLDKGMTPAEAADLSLKTHIDYGDLTDLERKALRRAMPFYTFSARAIPLHAEKLVTNPGKFAQYQKIREEAQRVAGLPDGYESNLDEYKQRTAGIPIKTKGGIKTISLGLPMTSSLNEIPTSLHPGKYADEIGSFVAGMSNPIIKNPIELHENHSFFFRDLIRDPKKPLVSAPVWVKALPASARKQMGVTEIKDPKTGKMVPGWDAKTNYVAKMIPGPVALTQQLLTDGTNQRGQGGTGKMLSGLLGVKVDDYDPLKVAVNNAYTMAAKIDEQKGRLEQQGKKTGKDGYYTPEYQGLLDKQKEVVTARDALVAKATPDAPVKVKAKRRPLSPKDQVLKEIADYKKGSTPAAQQKAIADEIAKYKAGLGG